MDIITLHAAVSAVCPVHGVSVGRNDDKSTWRIDFKDEATPGQRSAALSALAAFDIKTPEPLPRDVLAELDEAKATTAALIKKGTLTRHDIDIEKGK